MRRWPVKSTLKWKKNTRFLLVKKMSVTHFRHLKNPPRGKKKPRENKNQKQAQAWVHNTSKKTPENRLLCTFLSLTLEILHQFWCQDRHRPIRRLSGVAAVTAVTASNQKRLPIRGRHASSGLIFRQSWSIAIPFVITKEFWFCRNASGHFQLRRRLLQRNKRNLK